MKRILSAAAFVAALAIPAVSHAQATSGATSTQQTVTDLQASQCQTVDGAGQQTLTILPPPSQYVYITFVEADGYSVVAPSLTAMVTTVTGLGTTNPPSWRFVALAAVGTYPSLPPPGSLPHSLKSQSAGTSVVFTGNATVTSVSERITACYYFGF